MTGAATGGSECENFCVRLARPVVIALSDDPAVGDDHGSDHRIRAGLSLALRSKAKRQGHVLKILCVASPHYSRGFVTKPARRHVRRTHHRFLRATRDRLRPDRADVVVDYNFYLKQPDGTEHRQQLHLRQFQP